MRLSALGRLDGEGGHGRQSLQVTVVLRGRLHGFGMEQRHHAGETLAAIDRFGPAGAKPSHKRFPGIDRPARLDLEVGGDDPLALHERRFDRPRHMVRRSASRLEFGSETSGRVMTQPSRSRVEKRDAAARGRDDTVQGGRKPDKDFIESGSAEDQFENFLLPVKEVLEQRGVDGRMARSRLVEAKRELREALRSDRLQRFGHRP